MTKWEIYTDARASGEVCIIFFKDGTLQKTLVEQLDDVQTIADGEYRALEWAWSYMIGHFEFTPTEDTIICKSDSEFMIKQLKKEYKCKKELMRQLRDRIWALAEGLSVQYLWIPRNENLAGQNLENKKAMENPVKPIKITMYCGNCKPDILLIKRNDDSKGAIFNSYVCPNDCGTLIDISTSHPNYTTVHYNE